MFPNDRNIHDVERRVDSCLWRLRLLRVRVDSRQDGGILVSGHLPRDACFLIGAHFGWSAGPRGSVEQEILDGSGVSRQAGRCQKCEEIKAVVLEGNLCNEQS